MLEVPIFYSSLGSSSSRSTATRTNRDIADFAPFACLDSFNSSKQWFPFQLSQGVRSWTTRDDTQGGAMLVSLRSRTRSSFFFLSSRNSW